MSDKKTIEIDLYGAMLSQYLVDKIFAQASEGGLGDIILRNVTFQNFPRLIVDYGEIYETLCAVAKDYRDYKALVAGHWGDEAEGVIASQLEELPRPSPYRDDANDGPQDFPVPASSVIPMTRENKPTCDCDLSPHAVCCPLGQLAQNVKDGTDKMRRAFNKVEFGIPNTEYKQTILNTDREVIFRADIWVCESHAPGSEIEVKKGEKCFCGRIE